LLIRCQAAGVPGSFESVAIGQTSKDGKSESPEYQASIERWNALVNKYNTNIGEMDRIVQEIVTEVRKRG
jgi:hypothetical protein